MVARPKPRSPFGQRLRSELDQSSTSIRALSKRLNPQRPEAARRNLTRWLSADDPVEPSRLNRQAVAVALGLDPSAFDEDDEEDAEMSDVVRALMHRIDRVVEERVEERLRERQHA